MTWSLRASLPFASDQEKIDSWTTVLDTHVGGLANYTVSAHPSASATKRSIKITVPTNHVDGNPYDMYIWLSWSDYSIDMYEDATYSSVPGDTGTDTTSAINGYVNNMSGTLRVWESDQNSETVLITVGKTLLAWFPPFDEILAYEDPLWDGSADPRRTHVWPYLCGSSTLKTANWPTNTSGTSGTEYYLVHGFGGYGTNSNAGGFDIIFRNASFEYSTTALQNSTAGLFCMPSQYDMGLMFPSGTSSSRRFSSESATPGMVLYDGTTYWYQGDSQATNARTVFEMGPTEPDFS